MTSNSGVLSRQSFNTGLPMQTLQGSFQPHFGNVTAGASNTYSLTNALNGSL